MLNNKVGSLNTFSGDRVCVEVDLRSREKERRTVHMFVNKKLSPIFFYGVPECVMIGIWFAKPASIEFESLEELRESSVREFKGGFGYNFEGEKVLVGDPDVPLIKG